MNNQSSDFESQLRKLSPAVCDNFVEDTFYRAGWHAAMQSFEQKKVVAGRGKWRVGSFASGLLCGLLCCVVTITVWRSSSETASSVQIAKVVLPDQHIMLPVVDVIPKHVPGVEHPTQSPPIDLFATVTSIFQWNSPRPIESKDPASIPFRSLSVASQYQWSKMIASESIRQSRRASSEVSTENSDRLTLRAFPVSESEMLDLL